MALAQTADDVSNIAFAYMGSKALFCALDLGVFTALSQRPMAADDLAQTIKAQPGPLLTLLSALSGLKLVALHDGVWTNSPAAEAFLVKGAKYDFGDYLRLQVGRQMVPLSDQIGDVVAGTLSQDAVNSYAKWFSDPEEAALYSKSQHAGSLGPARQLAKSLNLHSATTLLDVGGGTGAFAITLCKAFPNLQATIVDFPNVAALGEAYVADAGLSERITYVKGDGREDIWPGEQDVVLMSYLFSGVPQSAHKPLVERALAHLSPGGVFLVHDFILHENRTGPKLAALWQLQHAAFTPEGGSLDTKTLTDTLAAAGFDEISIEAMIPELTMLARATKPAP
ncbi:MAG: methyltransferase [Pseudomonadota bacterium]